MSVPSSELGDRAPELGDRAYGKQRVRAITFGPAAAAAGDDEVADLTLSILLRGGVDECFEAGRNDRIVTSDALRNLALSVLERTYPAALEEVALAVAGELRRRYPHFPEAEVQLVGTPWQRSGATYVRGSAVGHLATATAAGDGARVRSGLDGIEVLITGGSRFVGFLVDEYTTNQPIADRPLSGTLDAAWSTAATHEVEWAHVRSQVHRTLLDVFGGTPSESVQHLLALMGTAVLHTERRLTEISLRMESSTLTAPTSATRSGARTFAVTTSPGAVTELTLHRRAS